MLAIWALVALQIKHCLADFVWQSPWMIAGKAKYAHPGGVAHAGVHSVITGAILVGFGLPIGASVAVAICEFVVHYHIDYIKALTARRLGLGPNDPRFWSHLGFDQLAHQLTYLAIVAVLVSL